MKSNKFDIILGVIRKAGTISRVEIAQHIGHSRATVTNITAQLLKHGFIVEKPCSCTPARGRRRVMLALNPNAAFVVGVKISAFKVSFAVVNFQGDVLSSLFMPLTTGERPEAFVADVIEEGIRHCVRDAKLRMKDISGIGIGIPGFVDSISGTCHWTPLYQKEQVPLRQRIKERLGVDVHIDNDANAVTVGQQWFGQGKGIDNFLVVTVEHGVGMGIVTKGKIYRGTHGIGAEFGHMVLVENGEPCRCGKNGCVEAYVSDISILRRAKEYLKRHGESNAEIFEEYGQDLDALTIQDVNDMAKDGHAGITALFTEGGQVLGRALAGLIQIFDPERVIITGEGVRSGDLLFSPMRQAVQDFLYKETFYSSEIIVQDWADDDWARGAAGFVLSKLYKSPLKKTTDKKGDRTDNVSKTGRARHKQAHPKQHLKTANN